MASRPNKPITEVSEDVSTFDTGRRRRCGTGAAVLWIVAGVGYLILEAIAAKGFRHHYSYVQNYISDLGVTSPGILHGRMVESPLAYLMNTAFYLQGIFFLLGAVLLVRAAGSRKAGWFLTCAAMNAVGNVLVGTVHSGPNAEVHGTAWVHGFGAALAIVGGNVAIVLGSAIVRGNRASQWYRAASLGLAVVGLLSFIMLVVDSRTAAINVLPDGAWERGSVYSIIVWQMFTAVYVLVRTRTKGRNDAALR